MAASVSLKHERIRRKLRICSHLLKILLTASLFLYTETFCLPYLTFVVLRELQCTYDEIKENIYKVMDAHLPQENKLD